MNEISVIMSIYKENVLGIRRAVDSILNQTFKDFEYIIIVDNPDNKEGIELIEYYASMDSRIRYVVHEKNMGISYGCNEAIKLARGKYIARQEPEDYSYPDRLQMQFDYMQLYAEVDILGTALQYLDVENKIAFNISYKPIVGEEIKRYSPIAHPTVFVRRKTFFKYGFYDENEWEYELWILWYIKGVLFHNLPDVCYDYHQTFKDKSWKTKLYLLDAMHRQAKYKKSLHFKFTDNLYLFAERVCSFLPSFVIIRLLYINYKVKKKKWKELKYE